jgi:peptidoglycan hydrolase CwlO-like protein
MSTYSDTILDKLNESSEKFYSALDDYSDSYVNYKLYPDYPEYQRIYANNRANIEALQADVFVATNNVQQNIDNLNSLIEDLNQKMSSEKTKNNELKSTLSEILSSSNGSSLLINQSRSLYLEQYISNITLVVGILVIFLSLFKVYSPKQLAMPTTL